MSSTRPIRHAEPRPTIETVRDELAEAKRHEQHLAELVGEGKVNADALATAQYRVSMAGRRLTALLAEATPGGDAA